MLRGRDRQHALALAVLLGVCSLPTPAAAHGINGHIWVTAAGLGETLVGPGFCDPTLASIFSDPQRLDQFHFAASFPDSGYVYDSGREYGETAHWEPFVEGYINWLRSKYEGRFTSPEALADVAFLLGLAQHGMQDEVFDSVFLPQIEEIDGTDQDIVDTTLEFIFVSDGHTDLVPEVAYPDDITAVFAAQAIEVETELIARATKVVRDAVIGIVETHTPGEDLAGDSRELLPWTINHYLDPTTGGSLGFERTVVRPYVEALWQRLTGTFSPTDLIISQSPTQTQPVATPATGTVRSRIQVYTGMGMRNHSINDTTVRVSTPDGRRLPVEVSRTRWGDRDATSRLIDLRPLADWPVDTLLTVQIGPGIELVDGSRLESTLAVTFTSPCSGPDTCADVQSLSEVDITDLLSACPEPAAQESGSCGMVPAGRETPLNSGLVLMGIGAVAYAARRQYSQNRRAVH